MGTVILAASSRDGWLPDTCCSNGGRGRGRYQRIGSTTEGADVGRYLFGSPSRRCRSCPVPAWLLSRSHRSLTSSPSRRRRSRDPCAGRKIRPRRRRTIYPARQMLRGRRYLSPLGRSGDELRVLSSLGRSRSSWREAMAVRCAPCTSSIGCLVALTAATRAL